MPTGKKFARQSRPEYAGELHVRTRVSHACDDEADGGPIVEPFACRVSPARILNQPDRLAITQIEEVWR